MNSISFQERRNRLFSELERVGDNCIAVIPAHSELVRNDDVHYRFRQESGFFYLTGFDEPDAIAVFRTQKGKREYALFVRPKDLKKEIWTGYRTGVEGAVSKYGADKAFSAEDFELHFSKILIGAERLFFDFFKSNNINGFETVDAKILRILNDYRKSMGRSGRGLMPMYSLHEIIGEMRIYKTPDEVERLRRAGELSAHAHREAMARTRPGIHEYQIEALLEYEFRNAGCARHGYPCIVASGMNATILHYNDNSKKMQDGEFLLIDAGGEYEYYTADITRTFPVNGKWTKEQAEIYDIVLAVQKECIQMARPGTTLTAIHQFAVSELTQAMMALGFLKGTKQHLVESLEYKKYYPHGTGHLLGMDVHDIGLYHLNGEPRKLEPGMVFTVEPGFYVLHDDQTVPAAYRGLGVRIEDDILITPGGHEVLTKGITKERSEISAIVGTKPWLT